MRNAGLLSMVAVLFAAGCGNGGNNGNDGSSGNDATSMMEASTTEAGASEAGDARADTREAAVDNSACPPTPPAEGDMCSMFDFNCDYGDDPRPQCRQRFRCCGFQFRRVSNPTCTPLAMGTCSERMPMSGTVCDLENNFCAYGTAHCFCQSNAGMLQWQCFAATADPGCPGQIPQVGTRCPTYGLQCDYNRPGAQGGFVVCAQDANRVSRWQDRSTMQATCPTM